MTRENVDARFCAEVDDGYLVVSIERDDRFSVTAEIHNSRRAYELGTHSCGCLHDAILRAFPDLAPIVALHLCDVDTGEPMHAAANGWYRLSGADMMHELEARSKGGRNYYQAPEPWAGYEELSPAFVEFFVDMAARTLNCDAGELSIWWTKAQFDAFVSDVLRPRWQTMADDANRLIDAMESTTAEPEPTNEESFTVTLDAGLRLSAVLMDDEGYRDFGPYFQYKVTVRDAERHIYTATFGGSVADYDAGRICAREAAFGTARELLMFEHETARGFIEDSCGESWEDLPAEQRRALTRAERAFDRMSDALIANRETLGG